MLPFHRRCCLIWTILWVVCIESADAVVKINLKSSLLTKLLGGDRPAADGGEDLDNGVAAQPQKSAVKERLSSDLVQLDLSGRIHSHIIGPLPILPERQNSMSTYDSGREESSRPLFWVPASPVSVFLSTDYDFSKRWYGARRLLATLRWRKQPSFVPPGGIPFARRMAPAQLDLVGERGLEAGDHAGEVALQWGSDEENGWLVKPGVRARLTDSGDASVSLTLPLEKKRLLCELNVINGKQLAPARHRTSTTSTDDDMDTWWIPDLSINALGHLKSRNEVSFPSPLKQYYDGNFGARLVVRRRLGWSVLGMATDQEPETWLRLDLSCTDAACRYSTTARLSAQLERLRSTAQVSLCQDIAVGRLPSAAGSTAASDIASGDITLSEFAGESAVSEIVGQR
jgi:hypothetical protein